MQRDELIKRLRGYANDSARAAQTSRIHAAGCRRNVSDALVDLGDTWIRSAERYEGDAKAADSKADALTRAADEIERLSAVPAGWNLVPTEPTEAMTEAYFQRMHALGFRRGINASEAWAALNSASPAPPSPWMEPTDGRSHG